MPRASSAPLNRSNEPAAKRVSANYHDFLVSVAVKKFRVPPDEAETLFHEVALAYLQRTGAIDDARTWMLGAMCHASRYYWRQQGRNDLELAEIFGDEDTAGSNVVADRSAAEAVLESLPPEDRLVLRLRYWDGCSIAEIAEKLGVKPATAEKRVANALRRAEKEFSTRSPNGDSKDWWRDKALMKVLHEFVDAYRDIR